MRPKKYPALHKDPEPKAGPALVPIRVVVISLSIAATITAVVFYMTMAHSYRAGKLEGQSVRYEAQMIEGVGVVRDAADGMECFTGCPDSSEVK